jgi:hypothetical protein
MDTNSLVKEEIKKTLEKIFPGVDVPIDSIQESANEIIFSGESLPLCFRIYYYKKVGLYEIKHGKFTQAEKNLTSCFLKLFLKVMVSLDAKIVEYSALYTKALGL